MEASSKDTPNATRRPKLRQNLQQVVILVVCIGLLTGGLGYFVGFQLGKKEGARLAVKKVTDFINPLNALANNPLVPGSVAGTVMSIDASSIQVKDTKNKEVTIPINGRTKVTKGETAVTMKEVLKDSQVTVLTTGKDKKLVATRIVIR